MSPATRELQLVIIRMLRGCLSAWEKWVESSSSADQKDSASR